MGKRKRFRVLLLSILLCVGTGWVAMTRDVYRLEGELSVFAQERENTYREVAQVVEGFDSTLDVVSVVTVTREFGFFGSPKGKITIYLRSDEPIGHVHPSHDPESEHEEEHDADARYFSGIQYFYEKVEGEWVNTESGQCSSEECHTDGRKAFERAET